MPGILYIYIMNRCGVQTWILKIRWATIALMESSQLVKWKKREKNGEREKKRKRERERENQREYRKHESKTEGTGAARRWGSAKMDRRKKKQEQKEKDGDRMTGWEKKDEVGDERNEDERTVKRRSDIGKASLGSHPRTEVEEESLRVKRDEEKRNAKNGRTARRTRKWRLKW